MKHLAPTTFRAFACAAGSCPDSCCRAGWEIVPDEETLKLYKTLPGLAGERVRAGIVSPDAFPLRGRWHRASHASPMPDEVGSRESEKIIHSDDTAKTAEPDEPLLRQTSERVCVLLDPDGLCHVQRNFGHEALCRVCREYPRFHREFGNLTEHGVSLSCPTAYALAVNAPLEWETWEDQAPVVPNELDPEAYLRLRRGRELALALLGREDLSLWQRIALVRRLAEAMQAAPEKRIHHDWALRLRRWETGIRARQAGIRGRRQAAVGAVIGRPPDTCYLSAPDRLAERFAGLEILSPVWEEQLAQFRTRYKNGSDAQCALLQTDRPEVYARYLAYSLYKYWLDALDDGNLAGRVERSVSMTLLGLAMDRAFPEEGPFLQRISREIEHCEENLAALLQ